MVVCTANELQAYVNVTRPNPNASISSAALLVQRVAHTQPTSEWRWVENLGDDGTLFRASIGDAKLNDSRPVVFCRNVGHLDIEIVSTRHESFVHMQLLCVRKLSLYQLQFFSGLAEVAHLLWCKKDQNIINRCHTILRLVFFVPHFVPNYLKLGIFETRMKGLMYSLVG